MAQMRTFDVSAFVDERKMSWYNARIIIASTIVTIINGYHITAAFFTGPSLIRAWGIHNMALLGPIFSANLAGIFFGSPLLGWVGDRWGRKTGLVLACLILAGFSYAAATATTIPAMIVYRFLAGLGTGGIFPLVIALNTEFTPKQFRATSVGIMFFGQTLGSGAPAFVTWMLAAYGWQSFYVVGGHLGLLAALITLLLIPESAKFLVLKSGNTPRARSIIEAMHPDLAIGPETELVVTQEKKYAFTPKLLFTEGRAVLTLLVWVMFVCNILAFYFMNSWMPTVLTTAHISVGHAALALLLFQVGGAIGCLPGGAVVDRRGVWPLAIFWLLSFPVVGLLGYSTGWGSESTVMAFAFLAGFLVPGVQGGINALTGLIYPVAFRSNGSGWAFAVGRLGAVAAPILAGFLIQTHMPIGELFLVPLIPLAIAFICCLVMAPLYDKQFRTPSRTEAGTTSFPTGATPTHA